MKKAVITRNDLTNVNAKVHRNAEFSYRGRTPPESRRAGLWRLLWRVFGMHDNLLAIHASSPPELNATGYNLKYVDLDEAEGELASRRNRL